MTNAETGERKDKAEKQKNGLGNFRSRFRLGLRPRAQDKTRTCTNLIVHYPLKVACLPISPPGQAVFRASCRAHTFEKVCKYKYYFINYKIFPQKTIRINTTKLHQPSLPDAASPRHAFSSKGCGPIRRRGCNRRFCLCRPRSACPAQVPRPPSATPAARPSALAACARRP